MTSTRLRHATIAAAVVAIVGTEVFSGGAAWATWTVPAHTTSGSVLAGSVAVAVTGSDQLATAYSSGALTSTAQVAVRNTGSVPSTDSLRLTPRDGSALSASLRVDVWPSAASTCTVVPEAGSVTTSTGPTAVTVATLLDAGAEARWCVRTSIDQGQRFDLAGSTTTVGVTASAVQGAWTAVAAAEPVTQSIADTVTPGAPTRTRESDSSIEIAWAAPADTDGIAAYEVERDGRVIASVPAGTRSFTDVGLRAATYYGYSVRAVATGPAGHHSPDSQTVLHATDGPSASDRYTIRSGSTGQCIAAGGTGSGSPVVTTGCATDRSQVWQFTPDGPWIRVTPATNPSLFWDAPSDRSVVLRARNDISAQRWAAEPLGSGTGTFQLRNKNDLCLVAASPTPGDSAPAMSESECDGSPAQQFTLQATR